MSRNIKIDIIVLLVSGTFFSSRLPFWAICVLIFTYHTWQIVSHSLRLNVWNYLHAVHKQFQLPRLRLTEEAVLFRTRRQLPPHLRMMCFLAHTALASAANGERHVLNVYCSRNPWLAVISVLGSRYGRTDTARAIRTGRHAPRAVPRSEIVPTFNFDLWNVYGTRIARQADEPTGSGRQEVPSPRTPLLARTPLPTLPSS